MQVITLYAAALLAVTGDIVVSARPSSRTSSASVPTGTSYPDGFDMKTSWGNLSPYKDADRFNVTKGFPTQCELSQVHVLHRHAERYPGETIGDGLNMTIFANKLAEYAKKNPKSKVATGPLEFLNSWEDTLGYNDLLPTGAGTEVSAGAGFWSQYGRLLYRAEGAQANWNNSLNVWPNGTARAKPTFRTTSYPRILESALWWLSGFFSNTDANSSSSNYNLVIIPEEDGFNNTLSPTSACTMGAQDPVGSYDLILAYQPYVTTGALERFSNYFPTDFGLNISDVWGMMNFCPYEYAALGASSFCSLFTEQEWRNFEYALDIEYYGNFGFGSPSGRAQGIGYVQELAARLESRLIMSSDSSINYTYDDNTKDFPLHQPMYMDMTHDNTIVSVLTALGLEYFNYGPYGLPLNATKAPRRTFHLSDIAPFGAHLDFEVWTCADEGSLETLQPQMYKNPDLSSEPDTQQYIRLVLNNAPVPFDGFAPCNGSVNGFCPLENFLSHISQLTEEAQYDAACFGDYFELTMAADGQPPSS
ncbi:uncharacterized protein N7483_005351 [Penicillium malachiteum]|uniref:uncharacterized protein n=1 Tax=Penicillium malachiteum TaxID=1324776 RepID=UPI00254819B8|nr:uncharacterized protein N7483_005351 [Penicillium malachiteum]KAJ5730843.1 hypothetical protein N7483_005351 [Penicillium malachiteum]